jgi:hypothetical protein
MKELQAGIQLVQAKLIQLNRHPVFKKKALKPVATKGLPQQASDRQTPLLSFPVRSSLEVLRQRNSEGLRRLESQAERINQLSAELEAAVFELKAIASEINPDWRAIQATEKSATNADICEYRSTAVPHVEPKQDGSLVLRSRPVDLFQAEREAALLAQTLRKRAKKKRGHRGGKL